MAIHVRAPLFDRLAGRDPRPDGEPRGDELEILKELSALYTKAI